MRHSLLNRIMQMKRHMQDDDASYSLNDLCADMGKDADASVLLVDAEGTVRGAFGSVWGNSNRIPGPISQRLASIEKTRDVRGTFLVSDDGSGWSMIVPVMAGGNRLGSMVLYRLAAFSDDDRVVSEYVALFAAFRLSSIMKRGEIEKRQMKKKAAEVADSLVINEYVAVSFMLKQMKMDEDTIVVSRLAEEVDATRSQVMRALRRLEDAGAIECRSSGMRGTHIVIRNPYLRSVFVLPNPS